MPAPFVTTHATWKHEAPGGLSAAVGAALARADKGDWLNGKDGKYGAAEVGDVRAIVAATLYLIGAFSTTQPPYDPATQILTITERGPADFTEEAERSALADALTTTFAVLRANAVKMGIAGSDRAFWPTHYETSGSDAPTNVLSNEAGWGWAGAVTVVGSLWAIGWIWTTVSTNGTTVALTKERNARMMQTHASVLRVFDAHRARELAAGGTPQPFTTEEKQTLALLMQAQDAAYKGDAQHDQDVPKGGLLGALGLNTPGGGSPGTVIGKALGTLEMLAIAGVIYVLATKH